MYSSSNHTALHHIHGLNTSFSIMGMQSRGMKVFSPVSLKSIWLPANGPIILPRGCDYSTDYESREPEYEGITDEGGKRVYWITDQET